MSLRDLPPGQRVGARFRRARFVPLLILVILSIAAVIAGSVHTIRGSDRSAARATTTQTTASPSPSPSPSGSSTVARLPAVCRPALNPPPGEPWLGGDPVEKAKADAVWAAHQDDMSKAIITGEDGWYDWGDIQAQNFAQEVGLRTLSEDEVDRWYQWMERIRSGLASRGIEFYVAVAPAKWLVYPQTMPRWAQSIRGSVPLDQLVAAHPDLPIIDLRSPLQDASLDQPVYSRVNSHWTPYGSWVGWDAITGCLRAADPALGPVTAPALASVTIGEAQDEFSPYGVPPSDDWTQPVLSQTPPTMTLTTPSGTDQASSAASIDLSDLPAKTVNPSAPAQKKLLLLRDSFGTSMSAYVDQTFGTTFQVRHNIDAGPGTQPDVLDLADRDHPDVVILQIASRHLAFAPPRD